MYAVNKVLCSSGALTTATSAEETSATAKSATSAKSTTTEELAEEIL